MDPAGVPARIARVAEDRTIEPASINAPGARSDTRARPRSPRGHLLDTLLLAGPGVTLYAVFIGVPLLVGALYSLTDWDGLSRSFNVVGLDNYVDALRDPRTQRAFLVSGVMTIATILVANVLGLAMALLINHPDRMTTVYRTIFFFPVVLSGVVIGFIWKTMLNTQGPINQFLSIFGVRPILFLGDPTAAFLSVTFVVIWQTAGFVMIIYLAGLQTIPREVVESSVLDGANRRQSFRAVTLPMLAPAMTVAILSTLIGTMKEFDRVVSITNGGPAGTTRTVSLKLFADGFLDSQLGYSSAEAGLLIAILAVVALVVVRFLRRRELDIQ